MPTVRPLLKPSVRYIPVSQAAEITGKSVKAFAMWLERWNTREQHQIRRIHGGVEWSDLETALGIENQRHMPKKERHRNAQSTGKVKGTIRGGEGDKVEDAEMAPLDQSQPLGATHATEAYGSPVEQNPVGTSGVLICA